MRRLPNRLGSATLPTFDDYHSLVKVIDSFIYPAKLFEPNTTLFQHLPTIFPHFCDCCVNFGINSIYPFIEILFYPNSRSVCFAIQRIPRTCCCANCSNHCNGQRANGEHSLRVTLEPI